MKKNKLSILALCSLPLMLSGCGAIAEKPVPTPILNAMAHTPRVKAMLAIESGIGGGSSSNYQSSGYPSIYGYETHRTSVWQNIGNPITAPSNVSLSHDTGVKIYGNNTATNIGSTNSIKIAASCPYIDFTDAQYAMPSSLQSKMSEQAKFSVLLSYKVTIRKYGSTYFHAGATINMDSNNSATSITYDKDGNVTTDTSVKGKSFQNGEQPIDFSKLGKVPSHLYSGDYTIEVEYSYLWVMMPRVGSIGLMKTTATMTASLKIDYTKPTISLEKSGTSSRLVNGDYSNQAVRVRASDSNFSRLYYKSPNSSYFSYTSSSTYTSGTTNGWWAFYAEDSLGNKSEEVKVYVDTNKPTARINVNGSPVSNGTYTDKSCSFNGSDYGSGISKCYYKAPEASYFVEYSSGSIIPNSGVEGLYQFYCVDKAGNRSDTVSIFLETSKPNLTIYRNGKSVYSDSIEGGESLDTNLYFNEGDTVRFAYSSKSNRCSVNGFPVNQDIRLIKSSYPGSAYSETITTATGKRATYKFRVVHEKPSITIDGKTYQDGAKLRFKADMDVRFNLDPAIVSGDSNATINGNKTLNLIQEKEVALSANDGEEKAYSVKMKDSAGNTASFEIVIDKKPSSGIFQEGNEIFENGSYVNHPVSFLFDEKDAKAIVSRNGEASKAYTSGTELTEDGTYVIVLTDSVGNTSEFSITVDTLAPKGSFYVDNKPVQGNEILTNKGIYLTWDGDEEATVNGEPYEKNTVISEEGIYDFVISDKAGNKSAYHAEIDLTSPNQDADGIKNQKTHKATRWWTVSGKAFGTYETALEYAKAKEREANVTVLHLDDVSSFNQPHLVADNGDAENHDDDPRVGEYWLYKSEANPESKLYYFDEVFLNKVIEQYAKKEVEGPFHWDGASSFPDDCDDSIYVENFGDENLPIGNDYVLSGIDFQNAYAVKEGTDKQIPLTKDKALGEQLPESGVYQIVERDVAGNSSSFTVIIDHDKPNLKVKATVYGQEEEEQTIDEESLVSVSAYYYQSFGIEEILDADPCAMVSISHDEKTSYYIKGDEIPVLDKGGEYVVRVYDRLNSPYSFTVYIVGNPAEVTFTENEEKTSFDLDIALEQKFDTLVSLEVYKDGQKLEGISPEKLHYSFSKAGVYKVVMKDNFGRTIEKELTFEKALPTGTLTGVEVGKKTNQDVGFSYDATKFHADVYNNGTLLESDEDGNIEIKATDDASGDYLIKLIRNDDPDCYQDYAFEIDTISPTAKLEGVEEQGTTNGDVKVSWKDQDVAESYVTLNGEKLPIENGQTLTKEGHYVLTLEDDLGNESTYQFTIDKTLDYQVLTKDGKAIDGNATTSSNVTISCNEDLRVSVSKDGEAYPYSFGDELTEEGSYFITISDDFGNASSFTVVIDKSVDCTANICDGGISNGPVTISSDEKVTTVVTKDGVGYDYVLGDEIKEPGTYKVTMTDAYGNKKEFSFQIVSSNPATSIDYRLGEGCEVTSVTYNGEEIPFEGNEFAFTEDGIYVISYSQDGQEYRFTLKLDTTAPTLVLNGVSDGGKVDGVVTLTDLSEEGTVEVYKDGTLIDYKLGDELKDYGHYEVVVKDGLGNQRTYSFDLEFQMNGWAITLIALGSAALVGTGATLLFKRKKLFKKK